MAKVDIWDMINEYGPSVVGGVVGDQLSEGTSFDGYGGMAGGVFGQALAGKTDIEDLAVGAGIGGVSGWGYDQLPKSWQFGKQAQSALGIAGAAGGSRTRDPHDTVQQPSGKQGGIGTKLMKMFEDDKGDISATKVGLGIGGASYLYSKMNEEDDAEKRAAVGDAIKNEKFHSQYQRYLEEVDRFNKGQSEYASLADIRSEFIGGEEPTRLKFAAKGGYIPGYADGGLKGDVPAAQQEPPQVRKIKEEVGFALQSAGIPPTPEEVEKYIRQNKNIAQAIEQANIEALMSQPSEPEVPGWMGALDKAKSYEHGGNVNGIGGPRDDMNPAMLSDGEFVMTADAVDGAGGPNAMYDLMHGLEGAR